jgi:YD repeat-containing protein
VAFTVAGNAVTAYVNGVVDATGNRSGAAATSTDPLRLGYPDQYDHYARRVDEVAIYRTALSSTRIAAHYAARTVPPGGGSAGPQPHAAIAAGRSSYAYDANGALTSRTESSTTSTHGYDLEGRQTSVTVGGTTTTFVYDGDGQLAAKHVNGTTVTHLVAGGRYEKDPSTGTWKKYYRFGGRLVAERDSVADLTSLHQDHLGSSSLQTSSSGRSLGQQVRGPFGQPWATGGSLVTDLHHTGWRSLEATVGPQPALGSLLHHGASSRTLMRVWMKSSTIASSRAWWQQAASRRLVSWGLRYRAPCDCQVGG